MSSEYKRKLQYQLAEAHCVIDLMLAQCSVPCNVDHAIKCSIIHLPIDLIERASAVFKEEHEASRKEWLAMHKGSR